MADVTQLLSQFLYGRLPQVGGSGGSASGVLTVSTTSAATIADTNETDLWTYSLPANTLGFDGRGVRVTASGSFGATANTKTVKLYFGSTQVHAVGTTSNAGAFRVIAEVLRTGAATQLGASFQISGGTAGASSGAQMSTPTENLSTAITIKITGQNGTAAANDIVFKSAIVELLN